MNRAHLFLLIFFFSFVSYGQLPSTFCSLEVEKFCNTAASGAERLKCLLKFESLISSDCKQEIQRFSQLLKKASGLDSFSTVTGGMAILASPVPVITYVGSNSPNEADVNFEQHRFGLTTPVYKDESDTYGVSLGYSSVNIGKTIFLSSSNIQIPTKLYRVDMGTSFSRKLENYKNLSARVNFGKASNDIDNGNKDLTFNVNGVYSFPGDENSHWAWTIFLSNNSPILNYIPIPGFIYFYRTEKLTGMFGIPFASIHWTPTSLWAISLSVFGPTINTELINGERNSIQKLVGFNWGQQTYLRSGREKSDYRIYFQEKRLFLGLRSPLSKKLHGELQAGSAYDRQIHEGSRLDKYESGKKSLLSSYFISWNLRFAF